MERSESRGVSRTVTEPGSVSKSSLFWFKILPLGRPATVMHTVDAQPVLMVDNSIFYYTVEQIPGPWLQFYLCKILHALSEIFAL